MVKITVDEAYAFDYYSILELKYKNGSDIKNILKVIKNDLIEQIGIEKFNSVIESQEYKKLYESNELTFDAVDKAKTDEVLASYVDRCNYKRMIYKKELQIKFFNSDLSEVKIGYNKLSKDE